MSDDATPMPKIDPIQTRPAGGTTPTLERVRSELRARRLEAERNEPIVELRFKIDAWTGGLFLALCHRYGITPYRHRGQRVTSATILGPEHFLNATFVPQYQAMLDQLNEQLAKMTQRLIAKTLEAPPAEPAEE
ncbi:MAG: hypothetical protein HY943_16915 [Gammaproteobacteria bacterium]|nr:hypothetical protein [Gammaproteobacteria bacterium]